MDSLVPSGHHEDGQSRLSDVLQALSLSHGFLAVNDYSVGVMDDAVAYGVGQQRIGQLLRPARNVKL